MLIAAAAGELQPQAGEEGLEPEPERDQYPEVGLRYRRRQDRVIRSAHHHLHHLPLEGRPAEPEVDEPVIEPKVYRRLRDDERGSQSWWWWLWCAVAVEADRRSEHLHQTRPIANRHRHRHHRQQR